MAVFLSVTSPPFFSVYNPEVKSKWVLPIQPLTAGPRHPGRSQMGITAAECGNPRKYTPFAKRQILILWPGGGCDGYYMLGPVALSSVLV